MSFRSPPPGIIEKEVNTSKSRAIAFKLVKTLDHSELKRLSPFHFLLVENGKAQGRDTKRFEHMHAYGIVRRHPSWEAKKGRGKAREALKPNIVYAASAACKRRFS